MTYDVERYIDGSVAAVGISDTHEVAEGEIAPFGIEGCSVAAGSKAVAPQSHAGRLT